MTEQNQNASSEKDQKNKTKFEQEPDRTPGKAEGDEATIEQALKNQEDQK